MTATYLSKAQIFERAKRFVKEIFVPAWDGTVKYLPMNMDERRQIRKECTKLEVDEKSGDTVQVLDIEMFEICSLVYCCRDESGARLLFTRDDIAKLQSEIAAGGISVVASAIMKESGITTNVVKRSEATPKEG